MEAALVTLRHSLHLGALLDALVEYVRDYVVMSSAQADTVALWAVHTHVIDAFETTPFLGVTSPEKRCGKSRLFDVLELDRAPGLANDHARGGGRLSEDRGIIADAAARRDGCRSSTSRTAPPNHCAPYSMPATEEAHRCRAASAPRCSSSTSRSFCAKALAGIGDASAPPLPIARFGFGCSRKRPDETARRFRRREALEIAEPIAVGARIVGAGCDAPSSKQRGRRCPMRSTTEPRRHGNRLSPSRTWPAAPGPSVHGGRRSSSPAPRGRRRRCAGPVAPARHPRSLRLSRRRPHLVRRPRGEPERDRGVTVGRHSREGARRTLACSSPEAVLDPAAHRPASTTARPRRAICSSSSRTRSPVTWAFLTPHRHNPHGHRVCGRFRKRHMWRTKNRANPPSKRLWRCGGSIR